MQPIRYFSIQTLPQQDSETQ